MSTASTVALTEERELRPTLDELCQNTRLLIKFRWVAGFSILFATGFVRIALDLHMQTAPLITVGCMVLGYNSLLFITCRGENRALEHAWRVAWGQILLDWMAMTALVHFTGGITSPALIYFVIHAALSGTVLLPWHARSLSLLAIVMVGGLAWLERAGVLTHVVIPELGLNSDLYKNLTYIAAVLFFFSTTMITLSELVSNKAQRLRQREAHIQRLFEARSTFMRVATHELRAPVAAGISLMNNLELGYAGEFNEQQMAILHRVTVRLEGLQTLVDQLLTLAASREASIAHVPLEPVSVHAVLEKIIEREAPNADKKQITLEVSLASGPGIVMAGDVGLTIVLGNLLNNAIKYTPEGGQVMVSYGVNRSTQQAEVTVADTGIGIPAADLPHVSDEFFRAQNAKNAQITGSGIGLATVRTLLERYHGTFNLQSKEGEGTIVGVTLPLAPRQVAPENYP
jgi:signal transduction histidine kinase